MTVRDRSPDDRVRGETSYDPPRHPETSPSGVPVKAKLTLPLKHNTCNVMRTTDMEEAFPLIQLETEVGALHVLI